MTKENHENLALFSLVFFRFSTQGWSVKRNFIITDW